MTRSGIGAWLLVAVLVALLVAAIAYAYEGMTFGGDVQMPTAGYVSLVLGIVASLIVGIGLMALVFYSSRSGYDEPPERDTSERE